MPAKIAILDKSNRLVGTRDPEDGADVSAEIVVDITAPLDGTLTWTGESFAPSPLIAVLDDQLRLTGTRQGEAGPGDVTVPHDCDLPMDGSYKWVADRAAFYPLGHGFARPSAVPPVSDGYVLYHLVKANIDGLPQEVRDWAAWYEENYREREEELQHGKRLRQRRGN